jgi:hypothetical protein
MWDMRHMGSQGQSSLLEAVVLGTSPQSEALAR